MPTALTMASAFIRAGDWATSKGDNVKGSPDELPSETWYQRSARLEHQGILLIDLAETDAGLHELEAA